MMTKRNLIILICLAWAAGIFVVSGQTFETEGIFTWVHEHLITDDESFQRFRRMWFNYWGYAAKTFHFLEFAILMVLGTWVVDRLTGRRTPRNLLLSAGLCLAYAATDEWHQAFVPQRTARFTDFLIDALGIAVASMILWRRRRRTSNAVEFHQDSGSGS